MPVPLLSLMLVVFGLTTGEFVIAGILPDVARDLSVSVPEAGRLVSAYALGMIVGGPVVTALTARLPRKPLIGGLVAVSILGNLGSALAPNYPVLLAARFAAGLVVATFFAVAISTAVSMAAPGREASTIAKVALGMNLGIVLGTPLRTLVGQDLGWRAAFAAVAAIAAVALPMVLGSVPAAPGAAPGSPRGELRVFAGRDVRLAIALTALGNVGAVTVFTYIAPLLTGIGGFGEGAVPVLLLVYGAGAVIGNLLGGRLSDRALMPSLIRLLSALAAVLGLFWAVAGRPAARGGADLRARRARLRDHPGHAGPRADQRGGGPDPRRGRERVRLPGRRRVRRLARRDADRRRAGRALPPPRRGAAHARRAGAGRPHPPRRRACGHRPAGTGGTGHMTLVSHRPGRRHLHVRRPRERSARRAPD
ncbi:MFS transporter [Actinomadura madurae]|uniref:MFS transporter n=1 Tax=Actinomadura madurae TaxID=1993 RepID=UPI0020D227D7|nr:MFS transporter [Actinomadura madurae]MCQ0018636.1 MFS transporter [Actinomadura madurae]